MKITLTATYVRDHLGALLRRIRDENLIILVRYKGEVSAKIVKSK
jgi:hypothetical protein